VKIDYEFTVGVPVDQAWSRMLDLEKIAPCLPGAAIQEEREDGEYAGTMKVEIGPITVSYKGTVKFEEADEANHRAVLQATGRETRGQGTASATIIATLKEEDDSTRVNVETGRGLAQDVATKMLDQFAACLEQEISGGGAAAEAAVEPAPENAATGASTAGGNTSNEDPAMAAGATVVGAVFAGSSPSEAGASAPTTSIQQPTTQEIPRREPPEEPEPSDLDAASQDAAFKRLTPVLAVASVLLVLFWLLRRKR
jgi:carbon monoxide dehydrogenase subunit G